MPQSVFLGPDWVILGAPVQSGPGKFMLIASNRLSKAELTMRIDSAQPLEALRDPLWEPRSITTLEAVLKEFVLVFGDSYADCLRKLLNGDWSPDNQPGSTAIAAHQALGPRTDELGQ